MVLPIEGDWLIHYLMLKNVYESFIPLIAANLVGEMLRSCCSVGRFDPVGLGGPGHDQLLVGKIC